MRAGHETSFTVLQATESWAGPGNEATPDDQLRKPHFERKLQNSSY